MDIRYVNVFGWDIWIDSFVMTLIWILLGIGAVGLAWFAEYKK